MLMFISLTLISCGSPNTVKLGANNYANTLISCEHKYDDERKFKYYQKNGSEYIVEDRLSVYKFVDINNKEWFINNFEILNYICTTGN